jgi:hypothetical protein
VLTALLGFSLVTGQGPAALASVPAAPCGNGTATSTDTTTTCTYASTGTEDTFTVPAGVTKVHVTAVGGSGGAWSFYTFSGLGITLNSRGAAVTSDLTVTPRATLYVEVGGNGASTSYPYGTTFGSGGFNGGADGGIGYDCPSYCDRAVPSYSGAGGGGASDVRTTPRSAGLTADSRLLAAAGGGGAASESGTGGYFGYTGGGGDAGVAGLNGFYGPGYGGGAGTATAGGVGGAGYGGINGQDGTDGTLGSGGAGGGTCCAGYYPGAYGAGGGGGGFYGGGGGGSHESPGGGGGGSSFASGANVAIALNDAQAQPYISISYEIPLVAEQAITFDKPSPVTYSATPITLAATASSALPVSYSVSGPCTVSGSTLTTTGAGDCVITVTQDGDSAFSAADPVMQTLTIKPAALNASCASPSRAYGAANPALGPAFSGFIGSDTADNQAITVTCTSAAGPASAPGPYQVSCNGPATSTNYTIGCTNGSLTVTQAGTTTIVTSLAPSPAAVNQPVTITATVSHDGTGASPTGTVSFYDGVTSLGSAPLATTGPGAGTATLVTKFGGGPHSITALYTGDTNYATSTSAPPRNLTVSCDQIITGTHSALSLTSGTTCLLNATIKGGIVVGRGGTLDLENSAVSGSVSANHPATVRMCGSTTGGIALSGATGYVRIGDPTSNCAANTINGGLTATTSSGGGTICGNTISGSWRITNNTPAFTAIGNHH